MRKIPVLVAAAAAACWSSPSPPRSRPVPEPIEKAPEPPAPAVTETGGVVEEKTPPPAAPPGTAVVQGGTFASLAGTGDISSGFNDADVFEGASGGFGSARGSGGGGTGWGTIGTGRYGTIGAGSGSGASPYYRPGGYGVGGGMRGRSSAVPTVSFGQPDATPGIDKALIRRYIKRHAAAIQYCYERELGTQPTLQGTVTATFTIGADGLVQTATAKGLAKVDTCIADVIKKIEFPRPRTNAAVAVTFPFVFRPS